MSKPEDVIAGKPRPFTGREYLESLRDGREVWIYGERVDDVTTHPAFRISIRSPLPDRSILPGRVIRRAVASSLFAGRPIAPQERRKGSVPETSSRHWPGVPIAVI